MHARCQRKTESIVLAKLCKANSKLRNEKLCVVLNFAQIYADRQLIALIVVTPVAYALTSY